MRLLAVTLLALCAAGFTAAQGGRTAAKRKPAPPKSKSALSEDAIAEAWLKPMTLRQRVAQLVVIRTHGNMASPRGREWRNILRWVRDSRVGGIIVVNRVSRGAIVKTQPYETVQFINRLQRVAPTPLIVGGDFERSVSMRFDGTIQFPHAMAYGAAGRPEWTEEFGRITAREARALGFTWVFAPVADVNNNADNPIIGIRAFGVDAPTASRHVSAFIRGAHSFTPGVLLSAKHFPGHGDTDADSHAGVPIIRSGKARLDAVELAPFRAAVAAGVDSVMTAHIALPELDPTLAPATISAPVISGLLRKELGFTGLITTDAMDMDGLAREYGSAEASVRALQAGVDILLMPRDPNSAIEAVMKAIAAKRLTAARITESARKLLRAKARLAIHRSRFTDGDGIPEVTEDESAMLHARKVADAAVAILRGDGAKSLPLSNTSETCVLALLERPGLGQGVQLADEVRARAPLVRTILLDPQMPPAALAEPPGNCRTTVIAAFLGFGGTGKLHPAFVPIMGTVGKGTILAAVGNPFLVRDYPAAPLALTTYSTVPVSETALAKVLFGEIRALGKSFLEQK